MKITDAHLKQIYAHAKDVYPRECFGFMVGVSDEGGWVRWVVRGTNLNTDRHDRFDMDPAEFLKVDRQAEDKGFEILGVYHSHPDWPAIPSQTDISLDLEGYLYLIVSVYRGSPLNTTIWHIADDPLRFVQLPLEIIDETVTNSPT